jgi:hypothetical protein
MPRTYVKKGGHGGKRSHVLQGSHEFALTINGIDCPKSVIGDWFSRDDNISDIAVGEEQYHSALDCDTGDVSDEVVGVHQHIYLKFVDAMLLPDVREIVLTLTDDIGFDLQLCKSRRNWLMYLSKEDSSPFMKNVRVSELSLWARANNHIKTKYRKPMKVDRADHFMVAAGNFRHVVLDIATNHIQQLRKKEDLSRVTMAPNMQCWLTRAIYNAFVSGDHLYLHGMPGVGKSILVDRLIHGVNVWRAGTSDRFMFSELDEEVKICLFDDFQPLDYVSQLPRIQAMMDKLPCTVSAKGLPDQTRLISAQFIFVSNEPIPGQMLSLERRVKFFCVDHKMYECLTCLFT